MVRVVVLLAISVIGVGTVTGLVAFQSSEVERLSWLAGCWSHATETSVTEEQWMLPSGGSMLGMSRTVRGGETTAHEFLQIRSVEGRLTYIAAPSNQAEAAFRLERIADGEVVFVNPEHDFPQRITYTRHETGVRARVEATEDGQTRGFEVPFTRCR